MDAHGARVHAQLVQSAATLAISILVAMLATSGTALATENEGVTSTNLSVGQFDAIGITAHEGEHAVTVGTSGPSDIYVVHNVIAPGGHTGWHTHPGPSLITVKVGTITAYDADDQACSPTVYTEGQGFVDPGGGHIHILRNEGDVPAETIAVQLLPHDAERRMDTPAPSGCAT
jgi:quercetin dioxygenase-like cupin family protein